MVVAISNFCQIADYWTWRHGGSVRTKDGIPRLFEHFHLLCKEWVVLVPVLRLRKERVKESVSDSELAG